MKELKKDFITISILSVVITLSCFFILGYTYSSIIDFIVVFICAFIITTGAYFNAKE
jgi:hypothetical protein